MKHFPFQLPYKSLDLRKRPDLYRIGKGEQEALQVGPFATWSHTWKSLVMPGKFKDPEVAEKSSLDLRNKFDAYRDQGDFVGCDMARNFVQMGYTRARRYANHKGGKKYETVNGKKREIPRLAMEDQDPLKVRAAEIFAALLELINNDKMYQRLRIVHEQGYESKPLDLEGIEVIEGVPESRGGEAKGEHGKRLMGLKKNAK
ncbi:BQ2448_5925 [Microbotryum intermedium]|uniref:BQ2448_5925 protein n=1 Tax=Microbotryum intermedium TaxID=269621 RepID=A0A238F3H7_9BASI|nr:BQ2448_5925 [Microbotryum intermedium]